MSKRRIKSNDELKKTNSRLHDDERIIPPGEPDAPADLTSCEQIIWDETVQVLSEAGQLTRLDGGAIHAYCRCVCEWQAAYADLQKNGYYQTAGTGALKLSVYAQRFNIADRAYQRWCSELGLSPKSRPAAFVGAKDDGPSLADILGGTDNAHSTPVELCPHGHVGTCALCRTGN